jgi:hypothetical protein
MDRDKEASVAGDVDLDRLRPTSEVGGEGGSPGDVEVGQTEQGTGAEADETWRPADRDKTTIARDETGPGRRSP